jgi:hypothetical protein
MAVEQVSEPDFYRAVTGQEYPGEYGERYAARRRGTKFEANLHQNDAALLRKAVGPVFGLNPDTMVVRDFSAEIPGPPSTMRALRLNRMRRILRDLARGDPVPDLIIQPQFALPTGGPKAEFVSPDFIVLDRERGMYVPGEEKSFITRDNIADPGDLDLTRRQAAAQILGLKAEAKLAGLDGRVDHRAVCVFATPYGLKPAPAVVDVLHAEVHEVERAIVAYDNARRELQRLRRQNPDAKLEILVDELPTHLQESCLGSCIMANICEKHHAGTARLLGDDATNLLGEMDLARIGSLLNGRQRPKTDAEREIVNQIRKAAIALGLSERELNKRFA